MVIELRQARYFVVCHKCPNVIQTGEIYLQTRGMGGSFAYCPNCASERGYNQSDMNTYRPKATQITEILFESDDVSSWNNCVVNLERLK